MARKVIDVHTHCFTTRREAARVGAGLAALGAEGLRHIVAVGLVNTELPREEAQRLVPGWVENRGDPCLNEAGDLLALAAEHGPAILPFVDTRHLPADPAPRLRAYVAQGFAGFKGLYLPDGRNDLGVPGIPEVLGLTAEAYRRREWEIFACAEELGSPVVYHIDARRHGEVLGALLTDFPSVRLDAAHLGLGRRAFAAFLERHPNLYTDLASLLPHARQDPKGYRDFLLHFPDRVCFGTDAFLYDLEAAKPYVHLVAELGLPAELEAAVFWDNPVRFLGSALTDFSF